MTLGAVSALGCNGEDLPGPSEPRQAAIVRVSGDAQQGEVGRLLCEPLVVRVTDAQGAGVWGVRVNWTVVSGAGVFWSDSAASFAEFPRGAPTKSDGSALAYFGPTVSGGTTVAAEVYGLSPVTFTIEATAPASPPGSASAVIYESVGLYYDDAPYAIPHPGMVSRYVLSDDGTFEFQFPAHPDVKAPGTYAIGCGGISLDFDNAEWRAMGTVRGDSLFVSYNEAARLADFGDALYVRSPGTP